MKRVLLLLPIVLLASAFPNGGKTILKDKKGLINNNITNRVIHSKGSVIVPFADNAGNGNGLYVDFYENTNNVIWPFSDAFYYSFVVNYDTKYQVGAALSPDLTVEYTISFRFIFGDNHVPGKGVYHRTSTMTRGLERAKIVAGDPATPVNWVECDSVPYNDEETQSCRFTKKVNSNGWFDRWDANGIDLSASFRFGNSFVTSLHTVCYMV